MAQIMVFTMITSLFYAFFFFMNLLLIAGPTGNVGDVRRHVRPSYGVSGASGLNM